MCSSIFLATVERFYFFQQFRNKTKTFLRVPTFFYEKQNIFIYSKFFGTKPKLLDVFQLFLPKAKRFYLIQKLETIKNVF
jgi:hypothetical protein